LRFTGPDKPPTEKLVQRKSKIKSTASFRLPDVEKTAEAPASGEAFVVLVEPWRAEIYNRVIGRAEIYNRVIKRRFHGSVPDFLRAACDALAVRLGYPVTPPDKSKSADC
jgi:hypothetical protein